MNKFSGETIRQDFPILNQQVNGYPLVYLDNAATTQKPNVVIDTISDYYRSYNSNVHRGAHSLSDKATEVFEGARTTVAEFIHSPSREQVLWTRGATEGINLVAYAWGRDNIDKGDKILVSFLEHHSNIVPWQLLAQEKQAEVLPIPIGDDGSINLEDLKSLIALHGEKIKLIAVNQVSNALGTVNPVADIINLAKTVGAKTLIDGAQAIAHFPVNMKTLGCDFYVFSGHKLFGPTGIGVLWGKKALLDAMRPYHGGGEMIETVSFSGTTFNALPYKFEAGTPDIAGAIGLAAAINYIQQFDSNAIADYERELLDYMIAKGDEVKDILRVGTSKNNVGVYSFLIGTSKSMSHPSDAGMLLDQQGVAVRTGHHCAQPLMERLGISGTVRASLSIYNTRDDIDRLFNAIEKVKTFLF